MTETSISIDIGDVVLSGDLSLPRDAIGLVLFAHGSGSSRKSPRNRRVANTLQRAGFATLLFDLLTEEEERFDELGGQIRFDIELLGTRLDAASDWVRRQPELAALPLGYFGASTGAAAALRAAAQRDDVGAVVSRGGRPDLAGEVLPRVAAPTLLIVGSHDIEVLALNRHALAQLRAEKKLEIVEGATHLFEEPGTLDRVAELATKWFQTQLGKRETAWTSPNRKTSSSASTAARASHPGSTGRMR